MPYGEALYDGNDKDTPAQSYKFNGKELDQETGYYYYGARYYDPTTTLWLGTDPLKHKYPDIGAYVYCHGNPVNRIDPDGRRPIPLNNPYSNWSVKVDSWFGPRNTGLAGASTYHRGLDFNYSGGGNSDYGTPILATHEGTATVDKNSNGGEGRSVVITSPDGSFRTRYFHLSDINIKDGQYISESDNIAKMGGSANGNDLGRTSHLHYEIQELQNGKWVSINPTGDNGNKMSNIIDPQKWITSDNKIYQGGTLPEVTVTATSSAKPMSVHLLSVEQPKKPEVQIP